MAIEKVALIKKWKPGYKWKLTGYVMKTNGQVGRKLAQEYRDVDLT